MQTPMAVVEVRVSNIEHGPQHTLHQAIIDLSEVSAVSAPWPQEDVPGMQLVRIFLKSSLTFCVKGSIVEWFGFLDLSLDDLDHNLDPDEFS